MKKIKLMLRGKQLMVLTLVFFLILPFDLMAKRKKPGAQLLITKKNGEVIKGELLKVKQNSLLLRASFLADGVTVDIGDIRDIKVAKKKGSSLAGLLVGILGGGIIGAFIAEGLYGKGTFTPNQAFGAIIGICIGGALGFIIGHSIEKDATIHVEGKKSKETKDPRYNKLLKDFKLKSILKKLKSLARFKE